MDDDGERRQGETESDEMRGCKVLQELTGSTGKATMRTTLDVRRGERAYLLETDGGSLLAEALTAEVKAVLADETSLVGAEAAAKRGRSAYAPRLARPSPTSILRSIARLLLPLSHSRTAYAYH